MTLEQPRWDEKVTGPDNLLKATRKTMTRVSLRECTVKLHPSELKSTGIHLSKATFQSVKRVADNL
jgi:hypothetical protein